MADRLIGYQRSIMRGAVFSAIAYCMIVMPRQDLFLLGLAMIIVGNGLFKPLISTLVGKRYAQGDVRRDRDFGVFSLRLQFLAAGRGGRCFSWPRR